MVRALSKVPAPKQPAKSKAKNGKHHSLVRKLHIVTESKALNVVDAHGKPLTKAFIAKAQANDQKIDDTLETIGRGWSSLGELFSENKASGYHVALGFASFADYSESKAGKSKSQVYQAMALVKELSSGPNPTIPREELGSITQENAKALVVMKKKHIEITPAMVTQAKQMPAKQFASDVVHPLVPAEAAKAAAARGTTVAGTADVQIRLTYTVNAETAAMMSNAEEIVRYVQAEKIDGQNFHDTFLQAMCFEVFSAHKAEYDLHKQEENAQGVSAALNANAGELADDPEDEEDDSDLFFDEDEEDDEDLGEDE
jgi:hypothetical protein